MGEKRLTDSNNQKKLPKFLVKKINRRTDDNDGSFTPLVIRMKDKNAPRKLEKLTDKYQFSRVIDNYEEQLAELFISENAQLYKATLEVKKASIQDYLKQHYGDREAWQKGTWVYYPWNKKLVHVLDEELAWKLRTIRNGVLISDQEQQNLINFSVGCMGMSVGSNGAATIALISGSKRIKIADGAVYSGSNMNRVRAKIDDIGENKAVVLARELYEMNPYMSVQVTQKSISKSNINNFFDDPWPLGAVIDEIDDIGMKVLLRFEAKKRGIPVIMVTEPGDTIILDIERYDLDKEAQPFHGLAGNLENFDPEKPLEQQEKLKLMMSIIGLNNLPIRDQQAMLKVGITIPSPPQLGSTATIAGGILAYAVRRIANNQPIKSGRHIFSLDHFYMETTYLKKEKKYHKKHSKMVNRIIKSM